MKRAGKIALAFIVPLAASVFIWGSWYLLSVKIPHDARVKMNEDFNNTFVENMNEFQNKIDEGTKSDTE